MVAEVLPGTIYANLSLKSKRYICKRLKYSTNRIAIIRIAFIRVKIKSALIVSAETTENFQ